MQLQFVLGDGNNGIAAHSLAKIVGMPGLPEAQLAVCDDPIPCRHDEAIARNILEETQRV